MSEQKVDHEGLQNSYAGKICPILSLGGLRPPTKQPAKIVGLIAEMPEPEGSAIACQGPNCMWFTPITDDAGVVRAGSCAISLIPTAVMQVQAAVATAAARPPENKIRPRV